MIKTINIRFPIFFCDFIDLFNNSIKIDENNYLTNNYNKLKLFED